MSAKRKVKKQRNFFKTLLVLGFFSYALYLFTNQSIAMNHNNAQLNSLNSQIETARAKQEELKVQHAKADTPEYKEEIARKRDGLVMPNEIIFIDALAAN